MKTVGKHVDDDLDLDALMIRVREVAMASGTSNGAAPPKAAGDANGADIDLVRIIDAQGEWNEQTRQSLAALVECLRTLRDDWMDAHARLREEIEADPGARLQRPHMQDVDRARGRGGAHEGSGRHRGDAVRRARRRRGVLRRTGRRPAIDWRRGG